MATLNLAQAARATGKTRTTVKKWIVSGRLSATRDASGNWEIDTAELERVGWIVKRSGEVEVPGTGQLLDEIKDLKHELQLLKIQLEAKGELAESYKGIAEERKDELQRVWEEYFEMKNQMKLLTVAQPAPPSASESEGLKVVEGAKEEPKEAPKKRGFWPWSKAA